MQGMATALFDLLEQHTIDPAEVKTLRVSLGQTAFDMHGKLPRYKGKFDALISGHYAAAVILDDRRAALAQFEPARYDDPQLRRFAEERVDVRLILGPDRRASAVEIDARRDDAAGTLRACARLVREPAFARRGRGQVPRLCQGPDDARPHRRGDRGGQPSRGPGIGPRAHGRCCAADRHAPRANAPRKVAATR